MCLPQGEKMDAGVRRGRPRSVPPECWGTVFRLYGQGHGYRRIANELAEMGVSTTKSSVERLIKGLPPYQGRRVVGRNAEKLG